MTEGAEGGAWYSRFGVQFGVMIIAGLLGLLILREWSPIDLLQAFFDKLPATLPLLSVALSIGVAVRDLATWKGWRQRTKELSLGALSFAIWYLVAAQNLPPDQRYIRVSQDTFLSRDYAIIVALLAVIWVALCSVAREQTATDPNSSDRSGWALFQALLLGLSVVGLLSPFWLFENRNSVEQKLGRSLDERLFQVSIPYEDEQFNSCYRPHNPLQVFVAPDVRTKTPGDAIRLAMVAFLKTPESQQSPVCRLPEGRLVKIHRELITVQEAQAVNVVPPFEQIATQVHMDTAPAGPVASPSSGKINQEPTPSPKGPLSNR